MKVGTDGVLIGAWANGGKRILDIGTGTGLIALMMAQRFDDAEIKAVDLDRDACCQARENVANSRFAGRVEVFETAIQQFHDAAGFDSIVSNPPFFQNSLKNPDTRRAAARHSDSLPFSVLFERWLRCSPPTACSAQSFPPSVCRRSLPKAACMGFLSFAVAMCAQRHARHRAAACLPSLAGPGERWSARRWCYKKQMVSAPNGTMR